MSRTPTVHIKGFGHVPLLDAIPKRKIDIRKFIEHAHAQSTPMVVVKPQRTLGAPWMDNFVARKKSVSLCPDCERRYGSGWVSRYNYISDKRYKELTDCDGCSQSMKICTAFYHLGSKTGKLILKLKRS